MSLCGAHYLPLVPCNQHGSQLALTMLIHLKLVPCYQRGLHQNIGGVRDQLSLDQAIHTAASQVDCLPITRCPHAAMAEQSHRRAALDL